MTSKTQSWLVYVNFEPEWLSNYEDCWKFHGNFSSKEEAEDEIDELILHFKGQVMAYKIMEVKLTDEKE